MDVDGWIRSIFVGPGGEIALDPTVSPRVAAVRWALRCLANPQCAGSGEILAQIDAHRNKGRTISKAEIEAAITPNGGYTKETLARWGIPWPPPKGWRKRLLRDGRLGVEP